MLQLYCSSSPGPSKTAYNASTSVHTSTNCIHVLLSETFPLLHSNVGAQLTIKVQVVAYIHARHVFQTTIVVILNHEQTNAAPLPS